MQGEVGGVMRLRPRFAAPRAAIVLTSALLATLPSSGRAATGRVTALEGIPRYQHVFTIVLENQNFAASWSGPDAKYLQGLRKRGAFAEQYFGTTHVSAGNYIAMTSGQPGTPAFNADCVSYASCYATEKAWPDGGRNIADQVEDSHQSWKAYMESMPGTCVHPALTDPADPYQTGYATRHNPFVYYPTIADDDRRCAGHVVPLTRLARDLSRASTTPAYAFITPDTCHDGHDTPCTAPKEHAGEPGGLRSADAFLRTWVSRITTSPAWKQGRSLLLITFDENGFSDLPGCCAPPAFGGRIGLVALDSAGRIRPGTVSKATYDHYSSLRTVEDALGITEHLNLAATSTPMADLFRR